MRYTNDRRKKKKLQTTLQLMDIKEIDQSSVITPDGQRISFILITPVNMSVLSDEVVAGRISALANILTSIENLQILCLNASQSYEKNKEHLAAQMKTETNEVLAELDRKDIEYLDDIRISMATGREFAFAVRFKKNIGRPQQEQTLKRLLLILLEAGFTARIAEEQEQIDLIAGNAGCDLLITALNTCQKALDLQTRCLGDQLAGGTRSHQFMLAQNPAIRRTELNHQLFFGVMRNQCNRHRSTSPLFRQWAFFLHIS